MKYLYTIIVFLVLIFCVIPVFGASDEFDPIWMDLGPVPVHTPYPTSYEIKEIIKDDVDYKVEEGKIEHPIDEKVEVKDPKYAPGFDTVKEAQPYVEPIKEISGGQKQLPDLSLDTKTIKYVSTLDNTGAKAGIATKTFTILRDDSGYAVSTAMASTVPKNSEIVFQQVHRDGSKETVYMTETEGSVLYTIVKGTSASESKGFWIW